MPPHRSIIGGIIQNLYTNRRVKKTHVAPPVSTGSQDTSAVFSTLLHRTEQLPNVHSTALPSVTHAGPTLFPLSLSHEHTSSTSLDDRKIIQVMQDGLARGTKGNYTSIINSFLKFCADNNVPRKDQFPATEFILCGFIASLDRSVAGSTASTAVTALKRWHELHNQPWNGSERLALMVKGVANNAPASSKREKRTAVTTKMLADLASALVQDDPKDMAVLACALVAFFGQARLGELLSSSRLKHNPKSHPSRDSVVILLDNNSREVLLPRTKTNQIDGQSIIITKQKDPLDPVKAIECHFRINHSLEPSDHLFAYRIQNSRHRRHSLTHEDFMRRVNNIWSKLGYPRITGHSFRIGGTTMMLRNGVPPEVVKELGRWSSDAFYEYWRDLPTIAKQHVQLLDLNATVHPLAPVESQARRTRSFAAALNDRVRSQGRPAFRPY
jgi:hypothetical protein